MEERRLLLAVALSLLVLTAYQLLFRAAAAAAARARRGRPSARARRRPRRRRRPRPRAAPAARRRPRRGRGHAGAARSPTSGSGASRCRARTSRVAFTNQGARLISWQLEHFRDARGPARGDGPDGARTAPRPLDLETGDAEVDARLREALFRPPRRPVTRRARAARPSSASEYADGDLEAEKVLRVPGAGATWSR